MGVDWTLVEYSKLSDADQEKINDSSWRQRRSSRLSSSKYSYLEDQRHFRSEREIRGDLELTKDQIFMISSQKWVT